MASKGLLGMAWLLVFQVLGEGIRHALSLPLPGPVIGLLLLLPALQWSVVRIPVAVCADLLLSNLSLLFVPVGVGVMTHLTLLQEQGLRILFVVAVSTWLGLIVTSVSLHWLLRKEGSD